tara:strand:+ start:10635 stop:11294 length:660 start_codon:yes stop_codon:yes gene_type:complete
MSKELLNESEIRKMMKIANLTPLAGGVISRLNETYGMEEDSLEEDKHEDPAEGMKHAGKDKDPVEEALYEDDVTEDMHADAPDDDLGLDDAGGADDAPVDVDPDMAKDIVMDILDMVMDAAKAKLGDAAPEAEIDADGADDVDGIEDSPMDLSRADADMETDMDAGGPPPDMGAPDDEEKPPMEEDYTLEEDDTLGEEFVNEVTRRVARRLIQASRKNS